MHNSSTKIIHYQVRNSLWGLTSKSSAIAKFFAKGDPAYLLKRLMFIHIHWNSFKFWPNEEVTQLTQELFGPGFQFTISCWITKDIQQENVESNFNPPRMGKDGRCEYPWLPGSRCPSHSILGHILIGGRWWWGSQGWESRRAPATLSGDPTADGSRSCPSSGGSNRLAGSSSDNSDTGSVCSNSEPLFFRRLCITQHASSVHKYKLLQATWYNNGERLLTV